MLKSKKIEVLNDLVNRFKESNHFIFTEYKGLTVEQMNELRKKLRDANSEIKVIKNSLAKRAVKEVKLDLKEEWFKGPIAVIFCNGDDFTKPTSIAYNFSKDNEVFKLRLAYFDNKVYESDVLKEIASLPSREELLARLVGILNSPITSLVFTLKSVLSKFVLTLKAIEEKKGDG